MGSRHVTAEATYAPDEFVPNVMPVNFSSHPPEETNYPYRWKLSQLTQRKMTRSLSSLSVRKGRIATSAVHIQSPELEDSRRKVLALSSESESESQKLSFSQSKGI